MSEQIVTRITTKLCRYTLTKLQTKIIWSIILQTFDTILAIHSRQKKTTYKIEHHTVRIQHLQNVLAYCVEQFILQHVKLFK